MKLRGIDFGRVWGASGVQGFFGEGYWFHRWLRPFGLNFDGATFVAKTTTFESRAGNMPLKKNFTPKERFPRCIAARHREGVAVNAVGLSNPGAETLLEDGRWQMRRRPFWVSFMSLGATTQDRLAEFRRFVELLKLCRREFRGPVGLQANVTCVNVEGHPDADTLFEESMAMGDMVGELERPGVIKLSLDVPVEVGCEIMEHPAWDGLCFSNTIRWNDFPEKERVRWFGSTVSPLKRRGFEQPGGISGRPLLPLVCEWIRQARAQGMRKPINGGGGILSLADAGEVLEAGADSVFLGSIAFLRPHRVGRIVRSLR